MATLDYDAVAWYVMRVTYQRELPVQAKLSASGIETFVPVGRVRRRNAEGVSVGWKTEPLVHNYIFIRDSLRTIRGLKAEIPHLRYMMGTDEEGLNRPQSVPDKQMQDFIKVVNTAGSKFLTELPDLKKGDRVRVLVGPFEGVEGIFVMMPRRHENRVVVQIKGGGRSGHDIASAPRRGENMKKLI